MPKFDIEAIVTINVTKTIVARNERHARLLASKLALPDVVRCSPDDDDHWDIGGELDGSAYVTHVQKVTR